MKVPIDEETPLNDVNAPVMRGLGVLPKHLHCCTPKWSMKDIMCDIMFLKFPELKKKSAFGFNCWQTSNFELMGDLMGEMISGVFFTDYMEFLLQKECLSQT